MKPVVVVGGGLSGLAAAVRLSSLGIPCLLLEARPHLGGRARSFVDRRTGCVVDNGQHVLVAAYRHTMHLLEAIGTRSALSLQRSPMLRFHHPHRGFCSFRVPDLPVPLNLAAGLLRSDLFSPADKVRLLRAGAAIARDVPVLADTTVERWLDGRGQSAESKRSFWEPLSIAIMNEKIAVASARVFLHALRTAFLSERGGAAIAVPTLGLSDLFAAPARRFIEREGGELRTHAEVAGCTTRAGKVTSVRMRKGASRACSAVILALPPWNLAGLLPEELTRSGTLAQASAVPTSAIVSIHLWFPHRFTSEEFVGVIGRRVQWIFNRRALAGEGVHGTHLSAVISAAGPVVDMGNGELIEAALDDVRAVFGRSIERPSHSLVIRERRGTFSCSPHVDRMRPGASTLIANLFLAGDWTDTRFPATIEGAIISGERAADGVAAFLS